MFERHFDVWPEGRPRHLPKLNTSVYENLEITARRLPDATAIHYYGSALSYRAFHDDVIALAGVLTKEFGVGKGDRVLLYMQNCPQYMVSYYAVLRADAVVVPVNPMSKADELAFVAQDSGARVVIYAEELHESVAPLLANDGHTLGRAVVVHYADYIRTASDLALPVEVTQSRLGVDGRHSLSWQDALARECKPSPHTATPDDWCVIPYSSGTTGQPKGCLHTHASVNAMVFAYVHWTAMTPGAVVLVSLPLFHVVGMQNSMNLCIFIGCTMVIMTRWNRDVAVELIERHRVTHWRSITTMAIDFFSHPDLAKADLSSLIAIGGGGAQVPKAVAESIREKTGLQYVEGYGLSETIAATHINPPQAPKPQCLGIPLFDVDSRIVDPETLRELGTNETGEIVVHGPQVFTGYWQRPEATRDVFFERDGKSFFRTGDLGYVDEQGYFFLVDRLKRMINASGYKIWPAEIESLMHGHADIQEVCVIAKTDARRGEQPKAVVVPRTGVSPDAEAIRSWCRAHMANYKVPVEITFVDALPKSHSGKVLWRVLQAQERQGAL